MKRLNKEKLWIKPDVFSLFSPATKGKPTVTNMFAEKVTLQGPRTFVKSIPCDEISLLYAGPGQGSLVSRCLTTDYTMGTSMGRPQTGHILAVTNALSGVGPS